MKKMRRFLLIGGLIFSATMLMQSCYPDSAGTTDEYTIVETSFNTDYDFTTKGRIYMPDTIAFFTTEEDEDLEDFEYWEAFILNEVATNFEAQGFVMIDSVEAAVNPPDMVAMVSGIAVVQSGAIWYPGPGYWWGYYPPGWGWSPGWGWYYPPGYGGYWSTYSYATGTISIFLADFKSAGHEIPDGIELEWNANINGLLNGIVDEAKIKKHVQQAFVQSPYLSTK